MKERLQRQLHPDTQRALHQAQRVAGKEPFIKQVPPLPHDVRAMLVRPTLAGRPYEIQVVRGQERVLDHLIVHEVGHLLRLHQVPEAERLAPFVTPETRELAVRSVLPFLRELASRGMPAEVLVGLFDEWRGNLTGQLANFPADLRIEQWIYDRLPGLRPVQRRSLIEEVQRGYPFFEPSVQQLTDPTIYFQTIAMNAAQAYHTARLVGDPTLTTPYDQQGYGEIGRRLLDLALSPEDQGHRSDLAATTAWAEELGLTGWFEWQAFRESR